MIYTEDANTYLTTEDLAVRYALKPSTIRRWRTKGEGPVFYTVGRLGRTPGSALIRYKLPDVLAWEQTHNITPLS